MFGFLKKRKIRRISDDLHETMVNAYDKLRLAVDCKDPDEKNNRIHNHLTALSLALHDVYPGFPQEKESLFTGFISTDLEGHPDREVYRKAIENHIRACPNIRAAKFEFMSYILAPKKMTELKKMEKEGRL